jgi:PAS domain S-box-containing protein
MATKILDSTTEADLRRRLAELEEIVDRLTHQAVERERLLAEERQNLFLAESLYLTGLTLNRNLNYEEVLDHILEQVGTIIAHEAVSIMLTGESQARMIRWRGYEQFMDKGQTMTMTMNIADTPTLRTMQETSLPILISDVEKDDRWVKIAPQNWIKSYLGAPLCLHNKVVGFLNLASARPDHFKETDIPALQAFVSQATIALQNARLFDQRRQENVERMRALKRERNFISTLLDTAGALVMVLNRYGRIIRFNRACEQTTGYSFEEVRGKYWWDLFLPAAEIEPIKEDFARLWTQQPPQRYESIWVTKNGEQRLIAWSNTLLLDSDGKVEYILNTGLDLTEYRQVETALHSSEERFRLVVSSISDHVYVTQVGENKQPTNLYLSPHVEPLTGYSLEKFQNDWSFWPRYVIHPDDQAAAAQQAARLMSGQNSEIEYRLVRADGQIIWVRDSGRCHREDRGHIIYGLVSDVTARKRAEEELRATNQQLQALTDRLHEELALAHRIQQGLLPGEHPAWAGLSLVCHTSAAREVGGDFYTYHAFESRGRVNRYAVAVGDVSGKGMPAALLMAASLSALQSSINQAMRPSELLADLDLAIKPYTKTTRQNCALCYAEISPPAPGQTRWLLRVANAGCIAPLVRRAKGQVDWVDVGGLPLGVGIGAELGYTEAILQLEMGDMIILTSDGMIESVNAAGELFGFERLEQAVMSGPGDNAAGMLTHLCLRVATFVQDTEPHDDLTILVIKI